MFEISSKILLAKRKRRGKGTEVASMAKISIIVKSSW